MSLSPQTDLDAATQPLEAGSAAAQLHALLHTAGVAALDDLGWLRITGEDRVRWLNGMVTNSIQDLKPGEGNFNFILSAQGRIQGTATAFALEDSILLQTDRTQLSSLTTTLDRFIIMDDVELTSIEDLSGILVAGPQALSIVMALGTADHQAAPCSPATQAPPPQAINLKQTLYAGAPVSLIQAFSPLIPRFEIWSDAFTIESLRTALTEAGAISIAPEPLEWLRILEGTPRYGTDIRDKELPQETAQTRALHFAKGCYLGQEIVERIRSRGAVHRTFAAFHLEGPLPAPGTPIEADDKSVGELTSTAAIPFTSGTVQIGLGYIRREALDRAAALTAADAKVVPISLPVREP
ncbi:MAG: folate-binding protein [Granulicella sp.]